MKLLLKSQREKLIANHRYNQEHNDKPRDFFPVVKLFTRDANAKWLLTELDPDLNIAFGLCDLGLGFPKLGDVPLDELQSFRGPLCLPIEREWFFDADKPLSKYHEEALRLGRIRA